jgi:hypothetical protein
VNYIYQVGVVATTAQGQRSGRSLRAADVGPLFRVELRSQTLPGAFSAGSAAAAQRDTAGWRLDYGPARYGQLPSARLMQNLSLGRKFFNPATSQYRSEQPTRDGLMSGIRRQPIYTGGAV